MNDLNSSVGFWVDRYHYLLFQQLYFLRSKLQFKIGLDNIQTHKTSKYQFITKLEDKICLENELIEFVRLKKLTMYGNYWFRSLFFFTK